METKLAKTITVGTAQFFGMLAAVIAPLLVLMLVATLIERTIEQPRPGSVLEFLSVTALPVAMLALGIKLYQIFWRYLYARRGDGTHCLACGKLKIVCNESSHKDHRPVTNPRT